MFCLLLALVLPVANAGQGVVRLIPAPHPVVGLKRGVVVVQNGDQSRAVAQALQTHGRTVLNGSLSERGAPESGIVWPGIDVQTVSGRTVGGRDDTIALGTRHDAQVMFVVQASSTSTVERSKQDRTWTVVEDGVRQQKSGTVDCATRTAVIQGTGQVYNAVTGELLDDTAVENTVTDSDCDEVGDDALVLKTEDQLAESAVESLAGQLAHEVLPRLDTVQVPLVGEQATRDAVRLARDDEWSAMRRASLGTLATYPYNAPSIYHVGVALELEGHTKPAADLYAYAKRIEDNGTFDRGIRRAMDRAEQLEILRQTYAIEITTPVPTDVADVLAAADRSATFRGSGERVEVRGGRNATVRVFSAASGGEEVARIGGGTRVYVVNHQGRDAEIQLPDGATGWIRERDLK